MGSNVDPDLAAAIAASLAAGREDEEKALERTLALSRRATTSTGGPGCEQAPIELSDDDVGGATEEEEEEEAAAARLSSLMISISRLALLLLWLGGIVAMHSRAGPSKGRPRRARGTGMPAGAGSAAAAEADSVLSPPGSAPAAG